MLSRLPPPGGRDAAQADGAVIIGSSPVLLIEGLLRARAGQAVTIVDAGDRPGGCWASADLLGLRDVEGACHAIINYRGVYRFLTDVCGIAMEAHAPPPLLVRGARFVGFHSRRDVARRFAALAAWTAMAACARGVEALLGRRRFRPLRRFSVAGSLAALSSFAREPILWNRELRYPVGGAPAMLRHLESGLRASGAAFVAGRAVRAILPATPGDGVAVELESGGVLRARELVVSESCELPRVTSDGVTRSFPSVESAHEARVVRLRGACGQDMSYVEFFDSPLLVRVTDATAHCRGTIPGDHRILVLEPAVGIRVGAPTSHTTALLGHLHRLGILSAGLEIVAEATHAIRARRSDRALVAWLQAHPGSVMVIRSRGDLGLSLHRNLRRWRRTGLATRR